MPLPDPRRSRIVLIGASEYTDPALPKLEAVERTVNDLAALFTDEVHGLVPAEHCTVLLNDGNLSRVGRRLREAAREATDLLLVYFTGHGLVAGRRHDLYLALTDSEYEDPEFNSIEYDKLRGTVLGSRATSKIIVLDCCFSGRAVTDTMAGGPEVGRETINQLGVAGTYVLTSAQHDQVALSPPGEDHTAFSGRLIRLLRDGVVGGPREITIEEVYQRLHDMMRAENLPLPRNRGTENADRVALALNRSYADALAPELRRRRQEAEQLALEGDWALAAEHLRAVLAEQTAALGEEHEETLFCRRALAHCVGALGDPAEGARLLRPLPEAYARVFGRDHEETLHTRQFLAVNLGESGHRAEAVALLRVLLADRSHVLGGEHEDTLRTRHILARNLALTGAHEEAVALLRQLIGERDRTLGLNHPHTVRARRDLAELKGDAPRV
ncbi:caspase family protein [Kitasatospora sp. NPDC056327]|uniref:caspase, EACC1-associated type n=1 Tax=Kitasatospora sp. NPDC056327 TaxID=3345785 RepID=UPI0035E0A1CD